MGCRHGAFASSAARLTLAALLALPLSAQAACDRSCLLEASTQYLKALSGHAPQSLAGTAGLKFTENNVPLPLGQALWNTVSAVGTPMRIVDPATGSVALLVQVEEGGRPALLAARLRLRGGKLAELDTVVARKESSTFLVPEGVSGGAAVMEQVLTPAQQRPRARLIQIADGYFRGLVDPAAAAPAFDPTCNRIENGVQTTNVPATVNQSGGALNTSPSSLGCLEQFKAGSLTFVSRLRAVSYPVVDEASGLVYASVIMDHDGVERASSPGGVRLSARLPSP